MTITGAGTSGRAAMNDVTAVIVTYNSAEHIGAAIASCERFGIPVVVVDNASTDNTLAKVPPGVQVIANSCNRGFAAAVNQGVAAHESLLTLLLNPDVQLLTPIWEICALAGKKRYTAAAGLLVDASGLPQNGFTFRRLPTPLALAFEVLGIHRIWPGNPVNRSYRCLDADLLQRQVVEQPAGAFLLFRRDDWEDLGGFDEQFFPLWFEDVDYCKRFREHGGVIMFEPSVRALHEGGHSIRKLPDSARICFWYASLLKYAIRHLSPLSKRMVAVSVLFGLAGRMVMALLQLRELSVLDAQFQSMRLAGKCLISRI